MVKVFSFSIFGTNKKYTLGLVKNLEIINSVYPDFEIWIYGGTDVPEEYITKYKSFANVKYIETGKIGNILTFSRFFPIDDSNVDICFIRDADSRINDRDQWCIKKFIDSDKQFQIIRDHRYHGMRIMAGMWAIKRGSLKISIYDEYTKWITKNEHMINTYGVDQLFLRDVIYPMIKDNCLIHSNIDFFKDEILTPIEHPLNNELTNFIGNVVNFKSNDGLENEYFEFKYLS